MPISDRELEHIRRKQKEFLDAVLVRQWTTPRRLGPDGVIEAGQLIPDDFIEAGQSVGLNAILVYEFIYYWINMGEFDQSYEEVAAAIRREYLDHPEQDIASAKPAKSSITKAMPPPPRITPPQFDVFISHAWEDKGEVALPLRDMLADNGTSVWFDQAVLRLGDSLLKKINEGLACSRYGVVILSKSFLAKHWPQQELAALLARETEGRKAILPIWHGIDRSFLVNNAPLLADRLAARTDDGLEAVVDQILQVLREEP